MFGLLKKIFGTQQQRLVKKYWKTVDAVNKEEEKLQTLSADDLRAKTQDFKRRFQEGETLDDLLPEAFAVVKAACRLLKGTPIHVSGYDQEWDMIPYDEQLLAGIAMHQGTIAEMQTGEGKTLTALLPLYLNALSQQPVHLVTVNDYLAKRDAEWVGTVLRFLGLTTGVLTQEVPTHIRKELYKCDVVYGTASEFGFDYLRDNSMAFSKEEQVQRGYFFAIIDEVDSILIDEARTPLIISGPVPESRQLYKELKGGVEQLVKKQRELCNQLATEAKRVIEATNTQEKLKKEEKQERQAAFKKLWLVSKGTPHHKVLKKLQEDPEIRTELNNCDLYFHMDQNKEEKQKQLQTLFLLVDERGNDFELTDKGIQAWPSCMEGQGSLEDFVMLDLGEEYLKVEQASDLSEEDKVERRLAVQQEDQLRKERAHNVRQLLRAHLMMDRDVDYIIQQGKVVIIDENTGRPQPGRRFSDGLHQAIEAKEGLEIQEETQTYATVTLQNYFRLYDKISGMTGTATTEAQEFKEIYQLQVLEIPTHKTCIRADLDDEIYMTEREKYQAILEDIKTEHGKGRPILVGTESVEISEKLSRILRNHKIPHTVLNAKHNEREAEIVAHAGKKGAVTLATNMAGRGTDIKLDEGVASLGGLYVLGTSRHPSRRIDRQLRGRSARQGDPGSSKFYLSFEDELLRLFASSNMTKVIQRFRPPEGEPISAKILNRSIETAQKRIEQRNYTIRKHTLEYDDVMNQQRQEIYAFRNDILHSKEMQAIAHMVLEEVIHAGVERNLTHHEGTESGKQLQTWLREMFPLAIGEEEFTEEFLDIDELATKLTSRVQELFDHKIAHENEKLARFSSQNPLFQMQKNAIEVVRDILLRTLDRMWIEHLLAMDHLRVDVMLRSHGQRDPLLEFKEEAFSLFDRFGLKLKEDVAKMLFRFQMVPTEALEIQEPKPPLAISPQKIHFEKDRSLTDEPTEERVSRKAPPLQKEDKTPRNALCPCGSGKKFKQCCKAS